MTALWFRSNGIFGAWIDGGMNTERADTHTQLNFKTSLS